MSAQGDGLRLRVLAEARSWLGTPYRHQAGRKGVGCDCLGLVRGVWAAVYGNPAPEPGPYGADWLAGGESDRLLDAARTLCGAGFPMPEARPGDLLVFRWRPGLPARHVGILSRHGRFIHAYSGAGAVESALVPGWRRRVAVAFAFPDP
ncbi:MAG: NlpC/P60 family protein [Zhengella sp.]|uniref:NlpC/P60 family protein n=1 Tax=Zhengella sp. TaxID=2282762 RepID=UPI003529BCE7